MAAIQIVDGRTSLWQWDTGVQLKLTGCKNVDELHFETNEGVISRDIADDMCTVPDAALQKAGLLAIYAFDQEDDGAITRHNFYLMVNARPKPADYIDPPDEANTIELIAQRVAEIVGTGGGGTVKVEIATTETPGIVRVGRNLTIDADGVLSVATADDAEKDNSLPITSAAVYTTVGNINSLLETI